MDLLEQYKNYSGDYSGYNSNEIITLLYWINTEKHCLTRIINRNYYFLGGMVMNQDLNFNNLY